MHFRDIAHVSTLLRYDGLGSVKWWEMVRSRRSTTDLMFILRAIDLIIHFNILSIHFNDLKWWFLVTRLPHMVPLMLGINSIIIRVFYLGLWFCRLICLTDRVNRPRLNLIGLKLVLLSFNTILSGRDMWIFGLVHILKSVLHSLLVFI